MMFIPGVKTVKTAAVAGMAVGLVYLKAKCKRQSKRIVALEGEVTALEKKVAFESGANERLHSCYSKLESMLDRALKK